MSLTMVEFDCRSLIQFCRSFHPYNQNPNSSRPRRFPPNSLCHRSPPLAVFDLAVLLSALAAAAYLIHPYAKFLVFDLLPMIHSFVVDLVLDEPLPYVVGFVFVVVGLIVAVVVDVRMRRCGNPNCKGLRRAVEYDIQLETEQCVKYSVPVAGVCEEGTQLELGQDRKELEAELKKMAPPNGRTVLIFRSRCGCPAGRLEVWGPKKVRRIKK